MGITDLARLFRYVPDSISRLAIQIGVHRVAFKLMFVRVASVAPHAPESLPEFGTVALQREAESIVPSRATGRAIIIDDPFLVEENFKNWRVIDEEWFNEYIEKKLYPKIIEVLYGNIPKEALNTFEKHVLEEYTHHLMVCNSSILTYTDLCSWAYRIYHMYLTEGIYRATKLRRSMDAEGLRRLIDLGEDWISEVVGDNLYYAAFKEALAHYIYIKLYALAIKPLVEGVTLALIERNPIEAAHEKFEGDPDLLDEVKFFVKKALQLLEGRNGRRRIDMLIKCAKRTINLPTKVIETIRSSRDDVAHDMWSLIRYRFEKIANGKKVEEAGPNERGFGMVVNYMTTPTPLNNSVISLLLSKVNEASKVKEGIQEYLLETFLKGEVRFLQKPAILVRIPSLKHIIYDPWADVEKLRRVEIGDLSDIIGDLAKSHKLINDMVFYRAGSSIVNGKVDENGYLKRNIIPMISCMTEDVSEEIIHWLGRSAKHIKMLEDKMALVFNAGVPYEELWDREVFTQYLTKWLHLIKEAARKGIDVYENLFVLSRYIHGIS